MAYGASQGRVRVARNHQSSPHQAASTLGSKSATCMRLGGLGTVVFGSGDLSQAHSDHEAVELDQVTRGIAILVGFLSVN